MIYGAGAVWGILLSKMDSTEFNLYLRERPGHYEGGINMVLPACLESPKMCYDSSKYYLRKSILLNPDSHEDYQSLSSISFYFEQYDSAHHFINKALILDPTNGEYLTLRNKIKNINNNDSEQ